MDDFLGRRDSITTAATVDYTNYNEDNVTRARIYNNQGPHFYGNDKKINHSVRLIKKNGKYNVTRKTETQLLEKYLRDFSTTLVASKWRKVIILSSLSFILTWLIFGVIWMLLANSNGDLENEKDACLVGIKGFGGYFLFSLETQQTIGYGSRSLTDNCPEAAIILAIQLLIAIAICGMTVNIVYMKMIKPTRSYRKKLFSQNAVICRRDGCLCLIFRVRDKDSRHAIGTTITAYVLRKDKSTKEPYLEVLDLEPHGFLIWPLEIVHRITETSPLYDVSSYNLIYDKFEIIVTLQGSSPTTGQCAKTRTSYVSSEILWGHRFINCVRYFKKDAKYFVHSQLFHKTREHTTHLCSAKFFDQIYNSLQEEISRPNSEDQPMRIVDRVQTPNALKALERTRKKSTVVVRELDSNDFEEEKRTEGDRKTFQKNNSELVHVTIERPSIKVIEKPLISSIESGESRRYPMTAALDASWFEGSKSLPAMTQTGDVFPTVVDRLKNFNSYTDGRPIVNSGSSLDLRGPATFDDAGSFYYQSVNESNQSLKIEEESELEMMLSELEDYLERNSSNEGSVHKINNFPSGENLLEINYL